MSADWEGFSLGGVAANDYALEQLSVVDTPRVDRAESVDATGTTHTRNHWRKRTITLSGSGHEPLYLPGIDYDAPLTLTLQRRDSGAWADANFTVLARRPVQRADVNANRHTWTLECVEVDATVLHSLPFMFSLGGVSPNALCRLDFSQAIRPIVGGTLLRMGSGAGQIREHWRKTGIDLSGGGWVPLNGLDALDYTTAKTLTISRLSSIDVDGNPIYTNTAYSVWTPGPEHDWDMVSRLYRWTLRCEEV